MESSPAVQQLSAGPISYTDRGSGPPVVFVHGLLVNGLLWRKVAPLLESDARVIVPDWPLGSHAVAMKPEADVSPRGVAHLIAEFLEALELEDVTIVGNDTGGAISQVLVTERPERVGRLVLTNCDAFDDFPPTMFKGLVAAAKVPGGLKALLAPMRWRAMHKTPLAFGMLTKRPIPGEVTEAWVRPALENADVRRDAIKVLKGMTPDVTLAAAERLHTFDKPALVAWAPEDRIFPIDHGRRLATLLPQGRLVEIPDSRAFISEDQPGPLADAIRELVREPVVAAA
jgi:pimeloyl-ACP methyl ester carboxylesterase